VRPARELGCVDDIAAHRITASSRPTKPRGSFSYTNEMRCSRCRCRRRARRSRHQPPRAGARGRWIRLRERRDHVRLAGGAARRQSSRAGRSGRLGAQAAAREGRALLRPSRPRTAAARAPPSAGTYGSRRPNPRPRAPARGGLVGGDRRRARRQRPDYIFISFDD